MTYAFTLFASSGSSYPYPYTSPPPRFPCLPWPASPVLTHHFFERPLSHLPFLFIRCAV
ncbi:hypothetical protein GE21DRAFT_1293332, partial [Neurospora crassa]